MNVHMRFADAIIRYVSSYDVIQNGLCTHRPYNKMVKLSEAYQMCNAPTLYVANKNVSS